MEYVFWGALILLGVFLSRGVLGVLGIVWTVFRLVVRFAALTIIIFLAFWIWSDLIG